METHNSLKAMMMDRKKNAPKDPLFMDPNTSEDQLRNRLRELILPIAKDGCTVIAHMNRAHPKNKPVLHDEFYKISNEIYK